jgi:hypothetical protein
MNPKLLRFRQLMNKHISFMGLLHFVFPLLHGRLNPWSQVPSLAKDTLAFPYVIYIRTAEKKVSRPTTLHMPTIWASTPEAR